LFVAGGLVPGTPPTAGGPNTAFLSFIISKHQSLLWQAWMFSAGAALLLWFATAVRTELGDESGLGRLFYGGFVAAAVSVLASGLLIAAVAYKAGPGASPQLARAFFDASAVGTGLFAAFAAIPAFVAFAVIVGRTGALPRWTLVLAVIAAVVNLAETFTIFTGSGFYSIEGSFGLVQLASIVVWMIGTAVALIMASPTEVAAPPASARRAPARGRRR
jgi:hypothetical protein